MTESLETPTSFDFPFTPYHIQHEFMAKLFEVIEKRQLGIFESPTGTGKSLSIICGAIRWLKDHNNDERTKLAEKIDRLKGKQKQQVDESTDWITSQSAAINLTHELNALKIEQNRIIEYDQKIEKLRLQKKNMTSSSHLSKTIIHEERTAASVDDEDDLFLLEDKVNDSDDDSEEQNDDNNKTYKPIKILICSRTHSQLSQFIGEIKKSPYSNGIRVVSLASRQSYCINPTVQSLGSHSLINERCLDMQKKANVKATTVDNNDGKVVKKARTSKCSKCPYFKQTTIDNLANAALTAVLDVEDLVTSGRKLQACPYYASRKAVQDAEIVLVPYNTILHKATREANGIVLKDNIVIIDEAHNLLEAMAQMHKSELNLSQIKFGLGQLNCYKQRFNTRFSAINLLNINQLVFILKKLQQVLEKAEETKIFTVENFVLSAQIDNYNMFKLIKFCNNSRIAQKVRNYSMKYPVEDVLANKTVKKGVKSFLSTLENKKQTTETAITTNKESVVRNITTSSSNPLLAVIAFLQSLTYSYSNGRILLYKNANIKEETKLQFLLLDSSSNFKDIINEARSVIVAGGTMKPISEFRDRLFIKSGADAARIQTFTCDHIVPAHNILPIILPKGSRNENLLFNLKNRDVMASSVRAIIVEACQRISGGIVVFFPSYSYEERIWQLLKDERFGGRAVFREPQRSASVDAVLAQYAAAVAKPAGALLLSVVGGKLSEGLNFSDDLGRAVIVVGLPYANITALDLNEKMSFLDKTEGLGAGQKFYEALCMKSVNQCIGRAVRHRDDYATVLLLDERYNRASTKNSLPDWIRRSLKVCEFQEAFQLIDRFFKDH